MGLTVSKCEKFVAEAPADKVKKHPAGDGLYFVVGRGRAYWSYQFRRGTSWSAKGLGGYPKFSPKDARDRLKHWQVTGSLHGKPPRAGPSTPRKATAEVGVPFTEALSQWLEIASQGWRNPVPTPTAVDVLRLDVAERADVIVEMNNPGVWVFGSTDDMDRRMGLGVVVEYENRGGEPQ